MADVSPMTDTSTDADTEDKNLRVISQMLLQYFMQKFSLYYTYLYPYYCELINRCSWFHFHCTYCPHYSKLTSLRYLLLLWY